MRFMFAIYVILLTLVLGHSSAIAESATIEVWKSPTCGCCGKWVEHLEENGFKVAVKDVAPQVLKNIKQAAGVPQKLASCHTARIGKYFVEGHVPAEDIKRLVSEKPSGVGVAVPGMPIGSPGMESGDTKEPYEVMLVEENGETSVYATH